MLRTKLTVEKLKTKSEILHLRSKQYQQKYENIDMNMVKQIEKMGNCQAQSKLKEIWYEECSREQENSHNIGQKKTKWHDKVEQAAIKEQNGEKRPNQQYNRTTRQHRWKPTNKYNKNNKRDNWERGESKDRWVSMWREQNSYNRKVNYRNSKNGPRTYTLCYAQLVQRGQTKRNTTTENHYKPNERWTKINSKRKPRYKLAPRRKQSVNGRNHFLSKRGRQPWLKKQ